MDAASASETLVVGGNFGAAVVDARSREEMASIVKGAFDACTSSRWSLRCCS